MLIMLCDIKEKEHDNDDDDDDVDYDYNNTNTQRTLLESLLSARQ